MILFYKIVFFALSVKYGQSYYCFLKHWTLKPANQGKASRPGGILNQAVKQIYGVYCLTGPVLKGVQ